MVHKIDSQSFHVADQKQRALQSQAEISFRQILDEKTSAVKGIKFSGHALDRLRDRNINLTPEQINKLDRSVEMASQKGAKSSLILMDDLALIVSIKNKTVITAIDSPNLKENVFTNIDSAVII